MLKLHQSGMGRNCLPVNAIYSLPVDASPSSQHARLPGDSFSQRHA